MSIYTGSAGICYIGAKYKTIFNTQNKRAFHTFGCRIRHETRVHVMRVSLPGRERQNNC